MSEHAGALLAVWADERAGGTGEEGEHTLYVDPENVDATDTVQVWTGNVHDTEHGLPTVGFWALDYANQHEVRFDLSPDQALDLAAMLVVHALGARAAALAALLDEAP